MAEEKIISVEESITQNDVGVILAVTAKDEYGNEIDLAGTTVYINIKRGRGNEPIKKRCDIVDAQFGKIEYIFQSDDLSIGGVDYQAELEIHYADGSIISSQEIIEFFVRKEIK